MSPMIVGRRGTSRVSLKNCPDKKGLVIPWIERRIANSSGYREGNSAHLFSAFNHFRNNGDRKIRMRRAGKEDVNYFF